MNPVGSAVSETATPQAQERIRESVGAGGVNRDRDVRIVQDLLNRAASSGLAVDGKCGPMTRRAIVEFQRGFLRDPDGRVDPDGMTFRKLTGASRSESGPPKRAPASAAGPTDGLQLRQLPQSGRGYYSYASADRQHGTDAMIDALLAVAETMQAARLEYAVGDISFAQGGNMPPHKSHRNGKQVDLRPVRSDGNRGPTWVGASHYSQEGTRTLVKALLAQPSVKKILFNDETIEGVRKYPGHHNHLHVELR